MPTNKLILLAAVSGWAFGGDASAQKQASKPAGSTAQRPSESGPSKSGSSELIVGRVVWLADELTQRGDVTPVSEAAERVLVLKTRKGQLLPLVEDTRVRAFRLDPRLRAFDVELLVRRLPYTPMLQVLRVYRVDSAGKRDEVVYWCDICSITMFELKACDCCQGPIELEFRPKR